MVEAGVVLMDYWRFWWWCCCTTDDGLGNALVGVERSVRGSLLWGWWLLWPIDTETETVMPWCECDVSVQLRKSRGENLFF